MAARERDALDALDEAIKLLDSHRGFIRARPRADDATNARNATAHEECTLALARAREAAFWASQLVVSEGRE